MSVTITDVRRRDDRTSRIFYESDIVITAGDEPVTFYIWLNGEPIGETQLRVFDVPTDRADNAIVDVFDDPDARPDFVFFPRARLIWRPSPDTAEYRIEQFINAAWSELARIIDDGNTPSFEWVSGILADVTTHQFRIVPIGTNGIAGTPTPVDVDMVRHPDIPDVEYSVVGGFLTVSAAT